MIGNLIDDEQGGFRAGMGCVDKIFTLKQICEKAREKMQCTGIPHFMKPKFTKPCFYDHI